MTTITRRTLVTAAGAGAAIATAVAPESQAAKKPSATALAAGEYVSTMNPASSGAVNATAFESDVAAAAGRQIVVPPGTYTVAAVEITGQDIDVRFMPGTLLVPDPSLHAVGPAGRMFHVTNCNTRLYGLVVDGRNIPEDCWRSDGGEFRAYDTTMLNVGFLDLPGNSTSLGTLGILCKGVAEVIIDGYVGRDFVGRKNEVFADQAGKVNHLQIYECERVAIRNVTVSGGEGEDNDFFHLLDLRPTPTMHGTIESCHFAYNGQTRRCLKFQGGNWDVRDIHCYPGSDFESVDPAVTDVGEQNLNCIDWAGSVAGTLRLSDSYVDATGYVLGVSHSGGPLGAVVVENCTIVGGRRHAIRPNPEPPHAGQDLQTMGFYAATTDLGSEIRDCLIRGFSRGIVVQGERNRIVGNTIDDPQDLWFQGGYSEAQGFLEMSGNKVYTRTAGALAATRCSRVDHYKSLEIYDNSLIRAGNDAHAAVFIDVTHAEAGGIARDNLAPAGTTAVRPGSSNVVVYGGPPAAAAAAQAAVGATVVDTTSVGNATTGEGTLQAHELPAHALDRPGAAVRTTFTGTTAANDHAKTLRVYVGGSDVLTAELTPGRAGAWEVQVVVIGTDADEQSYTARLIDGDTARVAVGSLTEASGEPITVKVTARAEGSDDVVGRVAVMEPLSGHR